VPGAARPERPRLRPSLKLRTARLRPPETASPPMGTRLRARLRRQARRSKRLPPRIPPPPPNL